MEPSSGKLFHHKMKILNLKENSNTEDVVKELRRKHSIYFDKVSDTQISSIAIGLKKANVCLDLIEKLKEKLKNTHREQNEHIDGSENVDNINQDSNPSRLDENKLNSKQSLEINSKNSAEITLDKSDGKKFKEEESGGWNFEGHQKIDQHTINLSKVVIGDTRKNETNGTLIHKSILKKPSDFANVHDKQKEQDSKKRVSIG